MHVGLVRWVCPKLFLNLEAREDTKFLLYLHLASRLGKHFVVSKVLIPGHQTHSLLSG